MIDRRRFVHSMVALGASTGLRPPLELFGAAPEGELDGLADAALASAKKLGASYADMRINQYAGSSSSRATVASRTSSTSTTTASAFASSSTAPGASRAAASSARRRSRESRRRRSRSRVPTADQRRGGRAGAGRRPTRLLEHTGQEEPLRHPDSAKGRSPAPGARRGAQGPGRELRHGLHDVRQRRQVLRLERGFAHPSVAHSLLPVLLGDGGRQGDGQVLLACLADGADGHGLRIRRELSAVAEASRRPRKPWPCTRRRRSPRASSS